MDSHNLRQPAESGSSSWPGYLYVALAFVAWVGTSAQVIAYLGYGPVQGTLNFWKESVATPASTFLVVDITILGVVVMTWMFGECRRLGLKPAWAWMYFLGSAFIGISIFMPLFFAHRQRRLRKQAPAEASAPEALDFVALAIMLGSVGTAVYYSLTHLPHS